MNSRPNCAVNENIIKIFNPNIDEVLQQYRGKDIPLVGIFNIKTNEIFLHPCIKERVWLEQDSQGNYVSGWKVHAENNKLVKGEALESATIAEYNTTGLLPRQSNIKNKQDLLQTAHDLLIAAIEQKNKKELIVADYRGFAVTLSVPPKFSWSSGGLNSLDHGCNRILLFTSESRPEKMDSHTVFLLKVRDSLFPMWFINQKKYPEEYHILPDDSAHKIIAALGDKTEIKKSTYTGEAPFNDLLLLCGYAIRTLGAEMLESQQMLVKKQILQKFYPDEKLESIEQAISSTLPESKISGDSQLAALSKFIKTYSTKPGQVYLAFSTRTEFDAGKATLIQLFGQPALSLSNEPKDSAGYRFATQSNTIEISQAIKTQIEQAKQVSEANPQMLTRKTSF